MEPLDDWFLEDGHTLNSSHRQANNAYILPLITKAAEKFQG